MSRKGFTLIELLIVVVIIGILAAIAIPKFANTKEKAYVSAMKSDLRNLAAAEEAYFADELSYTTTLGNLDFNTTNQVNISISAGTAKGWGASATHDGLKAGSSCAIYYGGVAAVSPATLEGVIECTIVK
ncbi:MAG: prepilin-type N-terminal cleavage/methylation domain-containing protein [Gemmatimonadota bacterium]|nr:MAG: prepilin-type N-terminal cleavage/methylation domain-containing protein [Gemmatimonadota bacterium]